MNTLKPLQDKPKQHSSLSQSKKPLSDKRAGYLKHFNSAHFKTSITKLIKTTGELEKGSLFVIILSTLGNGLNYLFQILMGRMLSVEEFGTLNVLLSVFMIIAVPSGAITALVAKYVVRYSFHELKSLLGVFVFRMVRTSILGFVVAVVIGVLFSPILASYLNITSVELVTFTFILISLNLLLSATTGIVQGLKQFLMLGFLMLVLPAIKLISSVITISLGYHVFGPLASIALAIIVIYVISVIYARRKITIKNDNRVQLEYQVYLKFFSSAFVLSACMTLLTNMDMVLIKHYLPGNGAELYSPIMVIGRILLYAPAALVQVMYPLTVESHAASPNSTIKLITRVLLFNTAIIVFCMIPLLLNPNFVLSMIFGEKYLESAKYILFASLFVVPVSYLTVLMNYALAVDRAKFITGTMILGCALNIIFVSVYHSSINQILSVMTTVGFAVVMVNLLYLVKMNKRLSYGIGYHT